MATMPAIFRLMLLSQQYNGTNVVSCVTVTLSQLQIIIIEFKIM